MSKKFKVGFQQKIKGRLYNIKFIRLGTKKFVLKTPVEIVIEKPTKPIDLKVEIK